MKQLHAILLSFMLSLIIIAEASQLSIGQESKGIKGTIESNKTWALSNSPYDLTGTLIIDNGATLTIEPGVIVNLNGYYIIVNGTFFAKGEAGHKILFNEGQISFTPYSVGWNQETQFGSIIQYAVLNGTGIGISSSPALFNNDLDATIGIGGGSPIILGNSFTARQYPEYYGGSQYTDEAIYINYNSSLKGTAIIANNIISGSFDDACVLINSGNPIIQNNLISDSPVGIDMSYITSSSNPIIRNNTIKLCFIGVSVGAFAQTSLNYNNFQSILNYTIRYSYTQNNLNASFNWWGTNDASVIEQKVLDYNDNFNLGKVTYTPFLTEANSQAMPDPNADISTPNSYPSQSAESTDNQPVSGGLVLWGLDWIGIAIVSLLSVVIVLLFIMIVFLRKRR